jgi:hypothetical protein
MKRITLAVLSTIGLSATERESRASAPTKPPPAGMSWKPEDVWKNVKRTTPADFWPAPPAEKAEESPQKGGGGRKGAAKKKQT